METISSGGKILAYIIAAELTPDSTTFLTPPELNIQVGFVVCPAGEDIRRHVHRPLERHTVGTSEVLLVKHGRCEVEIFDEDRRPVACRTLRTGDLLLAIAGGHGFRMAEDTVLLEIKQGPYIGVDEKERF
jgi:hypothetical protein